MVIERTYPKLSQIVLAKFELGRVKQINPASDHGITAQLVIAGEIPRKKGDRRMRRVLRAGLTVCL